MALKKVIATGSANTDDKAIEWLKAHGATVVSTQLAVDLIELLEKAKLERGNQYWQWIITFTGEDGNDEDGYVEIESYADLYETVLTFYPE